MPKTDGSHKELGARSDFAVATSSCTRLPPARK